jgi:membrane dipeptidase
MGLEGPNRMYELTTALLRRSYTDDQVHLVLGGNWARVLKEAWQA